VPEHGERDRRPTALRRDSSQARFCEGRTDALASRVGVHTETVQVTAVPHRPNGGAAYDLPLVFRDDVLGESYARATWPPCAMVQVTDLRHIRRVGGSNHERGLPVDDALL